MADSQFGKKARKHMREYGLNPGIESDRHAFLGIIDGILSKPEEVVTGTWRRQNGNCDFYVRNDDVVVINKDTNEFVTILQGGVNNERIKQARYQK
ncbi:MAG: hypothetical protein FWD27_04320 [Coriobacteriia bacterium]|nr:hypothetical protein [Coriobacteriia bacterium]